MSLPFRVSVTFAISSLPPTTISMPPMPQCHLSSSSYPREPLMDPIYPSPCLPRPPLVSEWLDGWLAQRKASPVCTLLVQCSPSLPSSSPEPHVAHPAASSRVNPALTPPVLWNHPQWQELCAEGGI
ncbi:hypothetical protein B0H13DRAFT_2358731 [Mycena leptocephala]|nr:hypothetical protein B0H13DRAFT_2358731 [Mycena leptocephala]